MGGYDYCVSGLEPENLAAVAFDIGFGVSRTRAGAALEISLQDNFYVLTWRPIDGSGAHETREEAIKAALAEFGEDWPCR
jgi:hypothetical protein